VSRTNTIAISVLASAIASAPTQTTVRGAIVAASAPLANAVTATPRYPADSFKPGASPRRAGPARSIFISTVIDQAKRWFAPRRTFAKTISDQLGERDQRRDRQRQQPAEHQQMLASNSVGERPGTEVRQRLRRAEGDEDESRACQPAAARSAPG
jgi:hypothetical protein